MVLWIAMPFSVFAMKDEMKVLRQELEKTNKLLDAILEKQATRKRKRRKISAMANPGAGKKTLTVENLADLLLKKTSSRAKTEPR